jgi:rod shape-determining protein MreD
VNFKQIATGIALLILQAGLAPLITFGDARPSLLLPFVVHTALLSGSVWACVAGFILGLFSDFLGSTPAGMSSLALVVVGFIAGRIWDGAAFRLWWPWMVCVIGGSLILESLRGLLLASVADISFFNAFLWSGLPSVLITSGIAALWFLSPLHKEEAALR